MKVKALIKEDSLVYKIAEFEMEDFKDEMDAIRFLKAYESLLGGHICFMVEWNQDNCEVEGVICMP